MDFPEAVFVVLEVHDDMHTKTLCTPPHGLFRAARAGGPTPGS